MNACTKRERESTVTIINTDRGSDRISLSDTNIQNGSTYIPIA